MKDFAEQELLEAVAELEALDAALAPEPAEALALRLTRMLEDLTPESG